MKITHIGHASILVETQGVSILSDPWWNGPCFGAQWWAYPAPALSALDGKSIDYIYVSHGHHDHFHPGTLNTLPKTAKVLVSDQLDFSPALRNMGFEVIEIAPNTDFVLPGTSIKVQIVPTHGSDTLMSIDDGQEVCLNLNDALHSARKDLQIDHCNRLRQRFSKINYMFCGYGVASHFPNCYRIPGKDAAATAARRQSYFNHQWVELANLLQPDFAFPFAADVAFLQEELLWANEATHNPERPTDLFRAQNPHSKTTVEDIAPGFEIENGVITARLLRTPIVESKLRQEMAQEIIRANRSMKVDDNRIQQVKARFEANLDNCRNYLSTCPHDYRINIGSHDTETCLALVKTGTDLRVEMGSRADKADLTYMTRWAYLEWALREPYGDELLFVGSGGIFEYASLDLVKRQLHWEVITLIRNSPPAQRQKSTTGPVATAKSLVKKLLGRETVDLYDLSVWTVLDKQAAAPH